MGIVGIMNGRWEAEIRGLEVVVANTVMYSLYGELDRVHGLLHKGAVAHAKCGHQST